MNALAVLIGLAFKDIFSKMQIGTYHISQSPNKLWVLWYQDPCGVAILLKKGVDCVIHSKILDPQGRYIILKVEIKDKTYVLINIYAPNKDTCIIKFLNMLLISLRKENLDEEENIILGGDFNCPLNPLLDKKGGILTPRKSVVKTIESLQDELDILSTFGELKILQ